MDKVQNRKEIYEANLIGICLLHAGPILESNANQQTSFNAIWENPGIVWIKTRNWNPVGLIMVAFTVYPVFVLVGIAVLIAIIVLAIILRRRR